MKKYVVREVVNHYHLIEVDDEVDICNVIKEAKTLLHRATGFEAIEDVLNDYQNKYGFDYTVKPNYCGTCSEGLEIVGCDDDSPELD
jgi:hypothetical protein|nr:MAG TPA: hypothetical protein [Caudoviricetes sp.]